MSPDEWRDQLLTASARETPQQEAEFLRLVDMVAGRLTPQFAKLLLATFSEGADSRTQERVCNVLAGATADTRIEAILRELPRLNREARQWADALMGELVEHDLLALKRHLHIATPGIRLAVGELLSHPDFCKLHPEAQSLRSYCAASA